METQWLISLSGMGSKAPKASWSCVFTYEWDTLVAAPSTVHAIPTAALAEKKPRNHFPLQEAIPLQSLWGKGWKSVKEKQTFPSGINISHVLFTMGRSTYIPLKIILIMTICFGDHPSSCADYDEQLQARSCGCSEERG